MFSLYILKSNLENDNNRYIGVTNNPKKRLQRHLRNSKILDYYSSRWINQVLKNNGVIQIEILLDNLTQTEAFEKEIEYIKLYRELGFNLTNISDGGTGFNFGEKNINYKHGLNNSKEYNIWTNIKRNDNSLIHPSWVNNPKSFIEYIKTLPNYGKEKFILTRKNKNRNFEPDNLEWISTHIRQSQQKKQKNNTSGYIGVSYKEKIKKWIAQIEIERKNIYIGCYSTREEAVEARNKYILSNNLIGYKIQNIQKN